MTPEERAREMVWKWGQRPDEDGKVLWKESERASYFSFPDTQEQVADIIAAIAEAREEAAKRALGWATNLDNVVAALKAAREGSDGGDMHDALLFASRGIAAAIRARA
jgi:hypothetical protein